MPHQILANKSIKNEKFTVVSSINIDIIIIIIIIIILIIVIIIIIMIIISIIIESNGFQSCLTYESKFSNDGNSWQLDCIFK